MEFKGTKGQWFIDYSEQYMNGSNVLCTPISTNQNINLCDVYGDDDTAKANTLLISKAPEMLKMLKELVKSADDMFNNGEPSETYYQLINKTEKIIKEATEL